MIARTQAVGRSSAADSPVISSPPGADVERFGPCLNGRWVAHGNYPESAYVCSNSHSAGAAPARNKPADGCYRFKWRHEVRECRAQLLDRPARQLRPAAIARVV